MRILLTNDDGIFAPGIVSLYKELIKFSEVSVVAPDSVQSACGHGITIREPLTVQRTTIEDVFTGWAVRGKPADCVKLALARLLDNPPDLIVSGINDGANVGINVLYSGTVAAAAEGAIQGFPSIAISQLWADHGDTEFAEAARLSRSIVERFGNAVMAGDQPCNLLNVNFPNVTEERPMGLRFASQATHRADDEYKRATGKDGRPEFSLHGWFKDHGPPEHDLRALLDGYVVLTPLQIDMTDHAQLKTLANWDWPDVTR
ncbi:MAG: 5'/3'-nucleotidase SurE [Planctomycetes bacterium]|nr:5'/3'-nucleotidase SurE [Planctomycetota bacterium]